MNKGLLVGGVVAAAAVLALSAGTASAKDGPDPNDLTKWKFANLTPAIVARANALLKDPSMAAGTRRLETIDRRLILFVKDWQPATSINFELVPDPKGDKRLLSVLAYEPK